MGNNRIGTNATIPLTASTLSLMVRPQCISILTNTSRFLLDPQARRSLTPEWEHSSFAVPRKLLPGTLLVQRRRLQGKWWRGRRRNATKTASEDQAAESEGNTADEEDEAADEEDEAADEEDEAADEEDEAADEEDEAAPFQRCGVEDEELASVVAGVAAIFWFGEYDPAHPI